MLILKFEKKFKTNTHSQDVEKLFESGFSSLSPDFSGTWVAKFYNEKDAIQCFEVLNQKTFNGNKLRVKILLEQNFKKNYSKKETNAPKKEYQKGKNEKKKPTPNFENTQVFPVLGLQKEKEKVLVEESFAEAALKAKNLQQQTESKTTIQKTQEDTGIEKKGEEKQNVKEEEKKVQDKKKGKYNHDKKKKFKKRNDENKTEKTEKKKKPTNGQMNGGSNAPTGGNKTKSTKKQEKKSDEKPKDSTPTKSTSTTSATTTATIGNSSSNTQQQGTTWASVVTEKKE
jgi:hypothetical protein